MKTRCGQTILALCLSWLLCGELHAGIIYSNLGPGDTFIINRDYDSNFNVMATTFVTTSGGNLGDISTPIFSLHSPVTFGLYTDSGGSPGTLLESWSATVPGFPGVLTTLTSVPHPLLSADTPYWFVIPLTAAQKDEVAWYWNNQGLNGGVWAGNLNALLQFSPASPVPAIQLASIAALPEPSVLLLVAGGLPALAFWRANRRKMQASRRTRVHPISEG